MSTTKLHTFFVLIIVLAMCIILTGCTSTTGQTTANQDTPAVTTSSPTLAPTTLDPTRSPTTKIPGTTRIKTTTPTVTITATATTVKNPVIVTLNSATKRNSLGTTDPKSGNFFLVLDVTINNTDKAEDFDYSDDSFYLYDKSNQKRYSPVTSKVASSLTNPFISGKVPLKSEIPGQVVFSVTDTGEGSYKFTVSNSSGTEIASFSKITVA